MEVDYKNVCLRSTRRLLPAQPQSCQQQEQAGSGSSAGRGICGQGSASAIVGAEMSPDSSLVK